MGESKHLKVSVLIGLAVLVAQVIIGGAVFLLIDTWEQRGQFGDIFGAANALFSGLAFAGLIFTILLQREELQLQRQELADTRHELQRTAAAQEASLAAFRAQAEAANRSGRLATISFLIDRYTTELEAFRGRALDMNDPRNTEREEYIRRLGVLRRSLEEFFEEAIGERR